MSRRLELYVQRTDGSSYCEAEARDDDEGRATLDRQAWAFLALPSTVDVVIWPREAGERNGGYRKGSYR